MTTNCYDSMVPFKVLYFQWMTRWSQHTICIEIFKTLNLYIEKFLAQESLGPNSKWVWITKEKCLKCFETASVNNSIEEHLWKITATFFLLLALLCCVTDTSKNPEVLLSSVVEFLFFLSLSMYAVLSKHFNLTVSCSFIHFYELFFPTSSYLLIFFLSFLFIRFHVRLL